MLKPVLSTHQVRLTEVADLSGPQVRTALDVDLIIVGNAPARAALARLPVKPGALRLALADDLPWLAFHGAPLPALLERWAGTPEGASVLGVCARLALALEPRHRSALEPLRLLVGAHRARFPELDRGGADTC